MSKSMGLKFLAVLLCAISIAAMVCGGLGIAVLASFDLYESSPEEYSQNRYKVAADGVAEFVVERYNLIHLSQVSEDLQDHPWLYSSDYDNKELVQNGVAFYRILDERFVVLDSNTAELTDRGLTYGDLRSYTIALSSSYPVLEELDTDTDDSNGSDVPEDTGESDLPPDPDTSTGEQDSSYAGTVPEDGVPETTSVPADTTADSKATVPTVRDAELLYTDVWNLGEGKEYAVECYQGPNYTVLVWLTDGAWYWGESQIWQLVETLYAYRYQLILWTALALLVFIAMLVYLGWAAGRKPGRDEIVPGGLNRLPLDLYLAVAGTGVFLLILGAFALVENILYGYNSVPVPAFALTLAMGFVAAVIFVCYYCALAAQLKIKGGFWWRHSVIGWCLRKIWHGIRWIWRSVKKLFSMMPLIWQWVAVGGTIGLLLISCTHWSFAYYYHTPFAFFLSLLIYGAVLGYSAYAFGVLYAGAKRMAKGDLTRKVPTRYLFGCFLDFAKQLNALADVAVVAAREQLKSERMKTELITNVSHDIKTPLTSIINYVDLLRKPHSEEEGAQYLEVLSRQSLRMKKLLEDLMEMSKASTGNIQVNIRKVDAVETVNQALGEFFDKLAAASLIPVFPQPKKSLYMMADGRLAWRVLSNVLSNAVKYALPGTRLYIDLAAENGNVVISVKNISREQLNISADELMERFVRGDTARNTEGSGLGLNIARSLMDIQHGKLQLLVDGDLFKVTLTFPGVK